jgi:DNA repair exonuclease SbcCD ATPase subunit
MLNKILLILSAVALAGGALLAFKNRKSFIETRTEKISINQTVRRTLADIDTEIANIDKEILTWTDASNSKRDKQAALVNADANVKAKGEDLSKIGKEIEEKKAEVAKMEADLKQVLGDDTIDTITAKVETLTQEIATLKTTTDNHQKEFEVAQKKVADTQATVGSLQKTASQRNRGITANSLEGTVRAVNEGFGFAVIDIGADKGVSSDSRLIVKRGNQRIGTLSISSIGPNKTVADIIPSSLTKGYNVNPGDRVIFEKTTR